MKAILTTLKLALPAAVVLLLAGCITDPYRYRGGYGGDYYYGQPSVEYRHYGGYGGYYGGYGGYGHPYYGRSGWSFGLRYGYPYGGSGRYGYGGWPYYYGGGWPYRPPIIVRPRPDPDPDGGHEPDGDPQGPPPWRDLDRLRDGGVNRAADAAPDVAAAADVAPGRVAAAGDPPAASAGRAPEPSDRRHADGAGPARDGRPRRALRPRDLRA